MIPMAITSSSSVNHFLFDIVMKFQYKCDKITDVVTIYNVKATFS